jgi:New glue family protein
VHTGPRSIAIVMAVALLVAGFALVSCGGDGGGETTTTTQTETTTGTTTETTTETTTTETTTEEQPPGPRVVRVRVVGGVPKGGIVRKSVKQGDRVVLVVTSDVADEVHLHGYDISRNVRAGGTARIRFRAKVPGRFEVELEQRGVQIADLTVAP